MRAPIPVRGGNGPLLLTPLELLDRLATLVPPPRIHRHRYFGGLVPAAARLPARGHTGVSARAGAKVQRQAWGERPLPPKIDA